MQIQRTNIYNNSFRADVKILGDKRILSKQDIANSKTEARKFAHEKDSIIVNIGKLNPKNGTRVTSIDINVNGMNFKETCNEIFDVDIRKFIVKFFEELNKPIK